MKRKVQIERSLSFIPSNADLHIEIELFQIIDQKAALANMYAEQQQQATAWAI